MIISLFINLLFYIVYVIFNCVKMYFIIFYLLFSKCVDVISDSVIKYLNVFEHLFIYSLNYPQIIYLIIIIFLCLGFCLLLIKEFLKKIP